MVLPPGHTILGCHACGTSICEVFDREPGSAAEAVWVSNKTRVELLAEQLHDTLSPLVAEQLQAQVYDAILAWLQRAEDLFLKGESNGR